MNIQSDSTLVSFLHRYPMAESTPSRDTQELLSGLEKLFEKYFDKDELAKEKTPLDKFFGTYLRSMKDEDEACPAP